MYTGNFNGGWSNWKTLSAFEEGHPAVGNPVAASAEPQVPLQVFARGRNGQLLRKIRGSGAEDWGDGRAWEDLGGICACDPSVAVHHTDNAIVVSTYHIGTDGRIHWKGVKTTRRADNRWQSTGWQGFNAVLGTDRPEALPRAGARLASSGLDVLWLGVNGQHWSAGMRSADQLGQFSGLSASGSAASDPVVVGHGSRSLKASQGPAAELRVARTLRSGAWDGPTAMPYRILGTPAGGFNADGRVSVVFRLTDGSLGHVFERGIDGQFGEGL